MLKRTLIALAAMGTVAVAVAPASALPLAPSPAVETATPAPLVEVRTRYDRNRKYDRHRDGRRCGNWSDRCRYRYGGYYYENPWWIFPMVGAGIALGAAGAYDSDDGYGSRHVAWCFDRYRSYNPRYNTWVSYSGRVRQCISPYGP